MEIYVWFVMTRYGTKVMGYSNTEQEAECWLTGFLDTVDKSQFKINFVDLCECQYWRGSRWAEQTTLDGELTGNTYGYGKILLLDVLQYYFYNPKTVGETFMHKYQKRCNGLTSNCKKS